MSDWNMKSYMTRDADSNIRRHQSDWHKKITLSLACIIFFFIGAPLGAIIRKGGLGMPVVISVLIFVLYYIIDSGATRVAKKWRDEHRVRYMDEYHHTGSVRRFPYLQIKQRLCGFQHRRVCKTSSASCSE